MNGLRKTRPNSRQVTSTATRQLFLSFLTLFLCLLLPVLDANKSNNDPTEVPPSFVETFVDYPSLQTGERVSLRCSATGIPLPMITWTLDGEPLDARKTSVEQQSLRKAMWGDFVIFPRFKVISHVNVTIESIYDGGLYQCSAVNRLGRVTHSGVLRVSGPPAIRVMKSQRSLEGSSIQLPCFVLGFSPPGSFITWTKDGGSKIIPFHHRQRILQNGSLEIVMLDKQIDLGSYTCSLEERDSPSTSSKSAGPSTPSSSSLGKSTKKLAQQTVYLDIKVPPVIEEFKFDSKLQAGMRTRVYCNVARGDTPVKLKWMKDSQFLLSGMEEGNNKTLDTMNRMRSLEVSLLNPSSSSSEAIVVPGIRIREIDEFSIALFIENLDSQHHNGNYSCLASNAAAVVNQSAQLVVNEPPIWVIEPKNTRVLQGTAAVIDCMVKGFPTPQVTWKRMIKSSSSDSLLLSSSSTSVSSSSGVSSSTDQQGMTGKQYHLIRSGPDYQVYENGSLRITSTSSSGDFLCIASNGIGPGISKAVRLTVNVPPFWVMEPKDLRVPPGSGALMNCVVKGYPTPQVTWKKLIRSSSSDSEAFSDPSSDGLFTGVSSSDQLDVSGKLYHPIRNGADYQVYENGSLRITSTSSSGEFLCSASNGIGPGISKTVSLTLNVPARFKDIDKYVNLTVKNGSEVELSCTAFGDQPLSIQWMKAKTLLPLSTSISSFNPVPAFEPILSSSSTPPSTLLLSPSSFVELESKRIRIEEKRSPESLTSQLILSTANQEDNRAFQCIAENEFGRDVRQMDMRVEEVFPETPLVINGTNRSKEGDEAGGKHRPQPILKVEETTFKSIRVRIIEPRGSTTSSMSSPSSSSSPSPASPLLIQKIFFKSTQPSSEWKHYVVEEGGPSPSLSSSSYSENGTFVLSNLLCGNHYQIYVMNVYRDGTSSTSEVLLAKTSGREPLAPPATVFLTRVNRTSFRLNVNTWSNGGCPILESHIEYRNVHHKHWSLINLDSLTEPIFLTNLSPEQFYKVLVSMKNSAGMTSVEYEIRMTDSKAVNVYHKNSLESSYNPDLVSVGTINTFSNNDFEMGPGHVTITLIVTLTLLLTLLAAVAILYRTIQKRLFPNNVMTDIPGDHLPVETQIPLSRVKNMQPFLPNNMTETSSQPSSLPPPPGSNYVALPSELSVLRSQTIDRRHLHGNNLKNSSSDSAFNVLTSFNSESLPLETAYQYVTVARHNRQAQHHHPHSYHHPQSMGENNSSFSFVSKSTRPLKSVNEPQDDSIPRYCTPNIGINRETSGRKMSSSSPKKNFLSMDGQHETLAMATDCPSHHCLNEDWNRYHHGNHLEHAESADDDQDDGSEGMNHCVHGGQLQRPDNHHCLDNKSHPGLVLSSFCNSSPSAF